MADRKWTLEVLSQNVVKLSFPNIRSGWSQDVLLSSDRHHDNLFCNHGLEKAHLDKALDTGSPIIDAGDLFCAMQGKYDPRKDYDQLREELKGTNYLDRLVQYAADFYGPYSDLWAVMGRGNHETSQLDRHGVDLTENLVRELRHRNPKTPVQAGGYGGWVWFQFIVRGTVRQSLKLKYYHGTGGDSPSTRGTLDINRLAGIIPDADIILTGHSHHAWNVPVSRERVSQAGKVERDLQWWVRSPGYKDDYREGAKGWAVETGKPPKPIGCVWLRFTLEGDRVLVNPILDIE